MRGLRLAMLSCVPLLLAAAPSDEQATAQLHDRRIEIGNVACHDFTGCKEFHLSLDQDGHGVFNGWRGNQLVTIAFTMKPYDFRKLQMTLETVRPPRNHFPHGCDTCASDYEFTRVVWHSDLGGQTEFVYRTTGQGPIDDVERALLKAQNMMLPAVEAETLVGHTPQPK